MCSWEIDLGMHHVQHCHKLQLNTIEHLFLSRAATFDAVNAMKLYEIHSKILG